tara:strand:+ start:575 stop:871 length:297 start_codon:yes stop_codon:yes gene_type:complete
MKNNDMEMNTTTKTATLCIDASLLARLNFDAANCTVKEADLLNKIIEGMDRPGEGWFHCFTATTTPTHSECAVLGSLIKKGLVNAEEDQNESWITLCD